MRDLGVRQWVYLSLTTGFLIAMLFVLLFHTSKPLESGDRRRILLKPPTVSIVIFSYATLFFFFSILCKLCLDENETEIERNFKMKQTQKYLCPYLNENRIKESIVISIPLSVLPLLNIFLNE